LAFILTGQKRQAQQSGTPALLGGFVVRRRLKR
jgi:hypothetical protein